MSVFEHARVSASGWQGELQLQDLSCIVSVVLCLASGGVSRSGGVDVGAVITCSAAMPTWHVSSQRRCGLLIATPTLLTHQTLACTRMYVC